MTDPGRFREQVAIQAATESPTGAGGYTEVFADVPAWTGLWAEIEPLRGTEAIRAMQVAASATHTVRLWAVEGVKSTRHRLRRLRDGAILEIVAPPMYDAARLQMEMLVHEVET